MAASKLVMIGCPSASTGVGTVTMKARDLGRVLAAVEEQPGLAAAFRMGGGA